MSKAVKITLIVATILIVFGIFVSTIALGTVGFDIRRLSNTSTPVQQSYTASPNANFQAVEVKGVSENYRIVQGTGSRLEITYYEDEQTSYEFVERGSALVITEKHKIVFMNFNFGFIGVLRETVITLPAGFSGSVELNTASGDVKIQGLNDASSLKVSATSGNITCDNVSVTNSLTLSSNSGDINCSNLKADSISLKATSGNIKCNTMTSAKGLTADSNSGSLTLSRVQADTIALKATSGNVKLDDVTAKRTLSANVFSGDIRGDQVQAETITFKTTSGNIRVHKIRVSNLSCNANSGDVEVDVYGADSSYRISAKSFSGDVRVPSGNTSASKTIDLSTTSGNIKLTFLG